MYFYSATTGGFYDRIIHGENMPSDVCGISVEEYTALIAAPSQGRMVRPGADGRPEIVEPLEPTLEQLCAAERMWRDDIMLKACAVRDRHRDEQELFRPTTLTPERFVELLKYIQSLRDWPQSIVFPGSEQRPLAPAWLKEHIQ